MKIIEKIGVLATMSLLLVFIIVISSSYAFFKPTIQGNDTAKRITLSSKKIPPHPLYAVLETLAGQGTYAGTYSGTSNDTYGTTGTKTIYYIKTSTADDTTQAATLLNKINVKFAGYCWQILRTTDTGGVKLIYNGEYVNETGCLAHNTETTHLGIVGATGTNQVMTNAYMYSDTFTYDTSTTPGTFRLVNPVVKNWSNSSDKEYILGKYTCMKDSSTDTCETIYYVNTPHRTNSSRAYYASYTIGNTQNAQIGTSPFNANYLSPKYMGYKFGDGVYEFIARTAPDAGSIMGKDVEYIGGQYVLKDGNNDSTHQYNGTFESDYHYTCGTTSATCTGGKVRYYYYTDVSKGYYYYTEFTGGDKVEDAIDAALDNSTNTYDSSVKKYLENWYYNNLRSFENYIDQNTVYCNDRGYTSLGGWSKTGDFVLITFNTRPNTTNLDCANDKDKFSAGNINAELNYPIGLATKAELYLTNNKIIRKTGQAYWMQSPNYFAASGNYMNNIKEDTGAFTATAVQTAYGIRPVITLKPSKESITGTGTLADPYVIGENN